MSHSTDETYKKLPLIKKLFDKPIRNYATLGAIVLTNQHGKPFGVLPATGVVTSVPSQIAGWFASPEGVSLARKKYGKPHNLPSNPEDLAVISASTYRDIRAWNEHCDPAEKVDLSHMLMLGAYERTADGAKMQGYYRGLVVTDELLANREIISEQQAQEISLRHSIHEKLPAI